MENVTVEIKLVIDGLDMEVGYELLERIADSLGDHSDLQEIYHKLAGSSNPEVRKSIAYYDKLRPETVELLLQDSEVDVLSRTLNSDEKIALATEDSIKRVIEEYPVTDVLKAVANNFEHIDSDNPNSILDLVVKKAENNFEVLGEIADSWDTPKYILKKLQNHSDIDIRRKATESLDR
jgi:DNA-binding protein Fis